VKHTPARFSPVEDNAAALRNETAIKSTEKAAAPSAPSGGETRRAPDKFDDAEELTLPADKDAAKRIQGTIERMAAANEHTPEFVMDLGPLARASKAGGAAQGDAGRARLPVVKRLASGKCYLQIETFDRTEDLARKLAGLNWMYPYALETGGTPSAPSYKLLVGPVNEGESNALALRFKRGGFPGAFIRREG
jgi:hypothetical protein